MAVYHDTEPVSVHNGSFALLLAKSKDTRWNYASIQYLYNTRTSCFASLYLKQLPRHSPSTQRGKKALSVIENLVEDEYRWCGLKSATCYPRLTYSAYLPSITTNNK
jgi:hypothetical protein